MPRLFTILHFEQRFFTEAETFITLYSSSEAERQFADQRSGTSFRLLAEVSIIPDLIFSVQNHS